MPRAPNPWVVGGVGFGDENLPSWLFAAGERHESDCIANPDPSAFEHACGDSAMTAHGVVPTRT